MPHEHREPRLGETSPLPAVAPGTRREVDGAALRHAGRPAEGLSAGRAARRRAAGDAGAAASWPAARSAAARRRDRRGGAGAGRQPDRPRAAGPGLPARPLRGQQRRQLQPRLCRPRGGGRPTALAGRLGPDAAANVAAIRAAMARRARRDAEPQGEIAALRHALLGLAHDADLVLDLHADNQAVLHLYLGTPLWPDAADLAAELGARAVLLAEVSGGNPFDEACSGPWWALARRFPDARDPARLPRRHRRAPLEQRRRRRASPRTTPARSCASSSAAASSPATPAALPALALRRRRRSRRCSR